MVPSGSGDWIGGKNPVRESLRAGRRVVHEILVAGDVGRLLKSDPVLAELAGRGRVKISASDDRRLDKLTQIQNHQGIAARVAPYPYVSWEEARAGADGKALFLILDCVQDPQNFGTLCRSALAFGVSAVVLPKDRSVAVTPAVCKSSSGAVEHLRIAQVVNLARALEELKQDGFWIYGTGFSADAVALNAVEPAPKSALVLGAEGEGLRALTAKTCDMLLKIPMAAGFDSLNVAQAGTVCLYEFAVRGGLGKF